jgi:uncharacterized protein
VGELDLFDAHTHVGLHDPSGFNATVQELVSGLELIDSRALVFPLHEPSGYDKANERVVEWSEQSEGRLAALARIDAGDDPARKAQHWIERGAVGLKLHTSSDGFDLTDPRLDEVFAFASENNLPIMAHTGTGRGGDAASDDAVGRAAEHPGIRLILAHTALDGQAWLWQLLPELPNVFIDTSWWGPASILSLMSTVPPGRVLYASDVPYASPTEGAILTLRCALQTGYDDDQLRSLMGGQLQRLVDRQEPLDLGPAPGEAAPAHPLLERIYVVLLTVVEPMMRGNDPGQNLRLARLACDVPEDFPDYEVYESVAKLIEAAQEIDEPDALRPLRTPGFDLLLVAALLARTPQAPVPDLAKVEAAGATG